MTTPVPVPGPTVTLDPAPTLVDNRDRDRYELWSGSELVGVVAYEQAPDGSVVLLHTVVTEKFGRAGLARLLVSQVLDDLEARGQQAVAVCTYVQQFVRRFPQYGAMLRD